MGPPFRKCSLMKKTCVLTHASVGGADMLQHFLKGSHTHLSVTIGGLCHLYSAHIAFCSSVVNITAPHVGLKKYHAQI